MTTEYFFRSRKLDMSIVDRIVETECNLPGLEAVPPDKLEEFAAKCAKSRKYWEEEFADREGPYPEHWQAGDKLGDYYWYFYETPEMILHRQKLQEARRKGPNTIVGVVLWPWEIMIPVEFFLAYAQSILCRPEMRDALVTMIRLREQIHRLEAEANPDPDEYDNRHEMVGAETALTRQSQYRHYFRRRYLEWNFANGALRHSMNYLVQLLLDDTALREKCVVNEALDDADIEAFLALLESVSYLEGEVY